MTETVKLELTLEEAAAAFAALMTIAMMANAAGEHEDMNRITEAAMKVKTATDIARAMEERNTVIH